MTTEVDRASQRLFGPGGLGIKNMSLFPGSREGMSTEEVAAELNRALDKLETGDYTVVPADFDRHLVEA